MTSLLVYVRVFSILAQDPSIRPNAKRVPPAFQASPRLAWAPPEVLPRLGSHALGAQGHLGVFTLESSLSPAKPRPHEENGPLGCGILPSTSPCLTRNPRAGFQPAAAVSSIPVAGLRRRSPPPLGSLHLTSRRWALQGLVGDARARRQLLGAGPPPPPREAGDRPRLPRP